jgi:hypothetical protein
VRLDVRHVGEHEHPEAIVGKLTGHADLLPWRKSQILLNAHKDATGAILDRKPLIERGGARGACA